MRPGFVGIAPQIRGPPWAHKLACHVRLVASLTRHEREGRHPRASRSVSDGIRSQQTPDASTSSGNGLAHSDANQEFLGKQTWALGLREAALAEQLRALDPRLHRRLFLDAGTVEQLISLPGTKRFNDLQERATILADWKVRLQRGVMPAAHPEQDWPAEPFRSGVLASLANLEMPRFCRRHPQLLDPLLKQLLGLVHDFEQQLADMHEDDPPAPQGNERSPEPPIGQPPQGTNEEAEASGGEGNMDWEGLSEEQLQELMNSSAAGQQQEQQELKISLEAKDSDNTGEGSMQSEDKQQAAVSKITQDILEKFEAEWKPAMENLEEATQAFADLEGLMEGPNGFDMSHAVWHANGWREVAELRSKLESLKELRELVRSLGRASGKGPKRRAPQEVEATRRRRGVVRSPLQPEETAGLTRSGDLSRMLPLEAHLMAAGWPLDSLDGSGREGSRGARLLHMVRRAERGLMSYERTGWLEGEPARATGRMEIRPTAELGPIIVCLDTSGSMAGSRETVAKNMNLSYHCWPKEGGQRSHEALLALVEIPAMAAAPKHKAVALECMRGAHRQERACYLYAFSGPGDVRELELKVTPGAVGQLLDFLAHSFGGGTDADRPLELSLQRLEEHRDWAQADILMVTDGEIAMPEERTLQQLRAAKKDLGLEVHGLLVGRDDGNEVMNELCTHLHLFKSWDAVNARPVTR